MKLYELLEAEITDLAQYRQNKQAEMSREKIRKLKDEVPDELERHNQLEHEARTEWKAATRIVNRLVTSARVPGFEDLDHIMYYITLDVDLRVEGKRRNILNMDEEERDRVLMIADHAPRLIAFAEQAFAVCHRFVTKWRTMYEQRQIHAPVVAERAADYKARELRDDIRKLRNLMKQARASRRTQEDPLPSIETHPEVWGIPKD